MSVLSSRPENQAKKEVWWSRLLIRLDYVTKQTLLSWGMENGFKVSRKEPKCDKFHNDLTKLHTLRAESPSK